MRKLARILMLCSLLLAVLITVANADNSATPPPIPTEGDVWDGSIEAPTKIVQKDGVNYYEITKCSQLAYVAQVGGEWLGRNYLLANNLILNEVVLQWDEEGNLLNDPATLHEWKPIGENNHEFSGCFNGNNYTISGVFINSPSRPSSYCIGLFGCLSDTRQFICNLNVINSYVCGHTSVGGIVGSSAASTSVVLCQFNGFVIGENYIGGIAGCAFDTVKDCVNFGSTKGKKNVGGIAGQLYDARCSSCANYGAVNGIESVGGIAGFQDNINIIDYPIENCYNVAIITGESNVGGIVGSMKNGVVTHCYSIGNVHCAVASNNVGAVVGTDSIVWGNRNSIIGCYYLKTASVNTALYGCGGVASADMEPTGFCAKSAVQLKQQSTFEGWDFTETWRTSPTLNNGYPYLAWQDVSEIPLAGLTLTQASLSLGLGDATYLTVSPQPATAPLPMLTWTSSDASVASVNANGCVSAVAVGTATITVSGGGFSANCAVTVSPRTGDEYSIGELTIRESEGEALTAIPRGPLLVTVPITKTATDGNSLIFLACYGSDGQYKDLLYVSVEDIPIGATIKVTLPVDNRKGDIAQLKAFSVASFANPTPLGAASVFPAS